MPLPPPYAIRPMTEGDIEAVLAIERQSVPTPYSAAGYRRELAQPELAHYLVLTTPAGVVGFTGYWLVLDEMQISMIAIHPQHRRRGLGTWLLLAAMSQAAAQGASEATLEVRRSNQAAQALYQRYGFEVVGNRPGYYKDTGEAALLMTAMLDSQTIQKWYDTHSSHLAERQAQ